MSDATEKARAFIEQEQAFRLGTLTTEAFHPKTKHLSQTAAEDLRTAVSMLQSVDGDIPPAMREVLTGPLFSRLAEAMTRAIDGGHRIFFTGCGATGRLSILLEAAWRRFWNELRESNTAAAEKMPDLTDAVYSVMAGGDFALIKSVEGFEDFPDFGRYQLRQAGVAPGDVVVAITEGGETPFVIGTAWEGLAQGAEVFFVYNNPTKLLVAAVERSRQVIEEPRITKIDLATGPMAISGSTRMQATTAEMLVVGAALETALVRLLGRHLGAEGPGRLGIQPLKPAEYHGVFSSLLSQLSTPAPVAAMIRLIEFEEAIYRNKGLVTYFVDAFLLDVLTDTTERSPTFMVPPFRRCDDTRSPKSWAFVKNPRLSSVEAWREMLGREPRGLEWTAETYEQLGAPENLRTNPPRLDNEEIYKFRIGNEPDPSRTDCPDSALITVTVGDEAQADERMMRGRLARYKRHAAVVVGHVRATHHADNMFGFPVRLPRSPLHLWRRLAVKLIFNTVSTATMVRMGRVIGNAMVWLSPSNKKLIDRGTRLVAGVTGCTYEQACAALFQGIDETRQIAATGREPPSPVAWAIDHLQSQHTP